MVRIVSLVRFLCLLLGLCFAVTGRAQTALVVYDDVLKNGWQDWSWGVRDFNNASPVHSGAKSIKATLNTWEAISFWHSAFNSGLYASVSFWANGGSGGQRLQIVGVAESTDTGTYLLPYPLPANSWTNVIVPLAAFGAANRTNFTRFHLQLHSSGTSSAFYVDDVLLLPKPYPALVQVSVNAGSVVRTADSRWFAVNTAIWDGDFDSSYTQSGLREMGTRVLRFPGGSASDEYHWATGRSGTNTWAWVTSFGKFVKIATNAGAQAFITVNYGTGTPEEAAAWVRHANITNRLGFKYWEIGNENYGTWETDSNTLPNHAYTYAVHAQSYMQLMRAADPSIKIGVVAAPGEDSYQNGYTDHPAVNPRSGQTKYGWTPVLLSTLKQLGARPDFMVHHHYPQWTDKNNPTGADNDDTLLASSGNWARDAADLRLQISDYYGPAGTNIELVVTENNSDAGAQGRQSTSLVNGLYYAESLGRLMQTEFNAFVWWDLRNGTDTQGDFSSNLYGWRTYGDLGMINGPNTRHPTFYAAKLLQYLAAPGDSVISAGTDFSQLSAYAARSTNGLLSLLMINKDRNAAITGRVAVAGFVPRASAVVRSYGKLQDEASRTNGAAATQDLSTNLVTGLGPVFTNVFPPYSMTLYTLSTAIAPQIVVQPTNRAAILGGSNSFAVGVSGDAPLVFQWRKNGVAMPNQTNSLLFLTNLAVGDFSTYTVQVTNVAGLAVSDSAALIQAAPPVFAPVQSSPGSITLQFPTQPGPQYIVEYRTNLASGSWTWLTNYPGNGLPGSFSDNSSKDSSRFYRVRLQ